jgi:hypothetical protein
MAAATSRRLLAQAVTASASSPHCSISAISSERDSAAHASSNMLRPPLFDHTPRGDLCAIRRMVTLFIGDARLQPSCPTSKFSVRAV